MNRIVTIEEAAKALKVSTKTVRRYLQSGKLSGHKIEGRWTVSLTTDAASADSQEELDLETKIRYTEELLTSLRQERDWLRVQVERLTFTNANLVATLHQQQIEQGQIEQSQDKVQDKVQEDIQLHTQSKDKLRQPRWKFWAA